MLARRGKMKNIFIIGSKGIPAKYGGFETFVDKLCRGTDCGGTTVSRRDLRRT